MKCEGVKGQVKQSIESLMSKMRDLCRGMHIAINELMSLCKINPIFNVTNATRMDHIYLATTNFPTQAIWLRKMPSETYIILLSSPP